MDFKEPKQLRLALYARVSTEEQREGQTIDSQIAELERFSKEKGWIISGTYKDSGWSGGIMARPELDRLRDDARKGCFDAVLINDVDRLARDVAHLGVIKRDIEKYGIKVIFRKLPSEASPTHNLMVNILGSFAEFERELIADRTRRGRRHKIEVRKQYMGCNTAYGYRYVLPDSQRGMEGRLEVAPTEAGVVKDMFNWVDQEGLSARRVVVRLTEMAVTPRKGAKSWGKSSVLRILHNEMYSGIWHYNKFQCWEPAKAPKANQYRKRAKCSLRMRPREEWLPLELADELRLVPKDQWERVQLRLKENTSFSPRNEKRFYLFKGLVRCGSCKAAYVGDPCRGKLYYRCSKRCRKSQSIGEPSLTNIVMGQVRQVLLNPKLITDQMKTLAEMDKLEITNRNNDKKACEKELDAMKAEETRLLEAYRLGVITPSMLGTELDKLRGRVEIAKTRLSEFAATSKIAIDPQTEDLIVDWCAEAETRLNLLAGEDLRALLRTLIEEIRLEERQLLIRGRVRAEESRPEERLSWKAEVEIHSPRASAAHFKRRRRTLNALVRQIPS